MSEEKTDAKFDNVDVIHRGKQIILPMLPDGKKMSFKDAMVWLARKEREAETEVRALHYIENGAPLDAAVAFHRTVQEEFGFSELRWTPAEPGIFGNPAEPPIVLGIDISATERIQVPLGHIAIPGVEGELKTSFSGDKFMISGIVKSKHAHIVNELAAKTRAYLTKQSIYKGAAIKMSFAYVERVEDGGRYDPISDQPRFMNLSGVKETDLIFGQAVQDALEIGLFAPIENSDALRKCGVPLKRGVLPFGKYGTGKTMIAHVTALKAHRNGWTFIYLDSVRDLKHGLRFAAQYAPAVVFAEDIDRAVTGERNEDMDEILNTLDGVDTKGAEIITVLTTNHVDKINPAMLRQGRIDVAIEIEPPDADAAEKIVRLYARGYLEAGASLEKIGKILSGRIPAFIRECTERAKIAAIARIKSHKIEGQVLEQDLLAAAHAMESHARMLEPRASREAPRNPIVMVQASDEVREQVGEMLVSATNGSALRQ